MIMDFKEKLVDYWKKTLIGMVGLVVITGLLWWHYDDPETAKFVAYLLGGGFLLWQVRASSKRAKAAEDTASAMQQTANLTEKGNIAERFKNAIEHLGGKSASVRMGGVYALHHIAQDVEEYRERVFEILCAHIRETTTQDGYKPQEVLDSETDVSVIRPSVEIGSILNLLFHWLPDRRIYKKYRASLEHANLIGAILINSDLREVFLPFANLEGAFLSDANLQDAILSFSNLHGARLNNTNLQGADLSSAKNLTVEQLLKAKTLYQAELPDGMEAEIKKYKPELLEKPKPDNEPEA